jgi:hypothetical protein
MGADAEQVLDWIEGMIRLDPAERMTAKASRDHSLLSTGPTLVPRGYRSQIPAEDMKDDGRLVEVISGMEIASMLNNELNVAHERLQDIIRGN